MKNVSVYNADYHPLLGQLMNKMQLPQIINEAVEKTNSQAKLDSGTMIAGMILNLLSDSKIRLYRLSHFFEDKPTPLIFPWNPEVKAKDFTEDRGGDVLDELFRANPQKVFSMVTQNNLKLFDISSDGVRVDTTSKSFYGAYETDETPLVDITYGYSKDKRPDLKQIMFGIGTSVDGVPILGEVLSGNTSDKTFNNGWIKTVRQALQKNDTDFLLYTADSEVVTEDNFKLLKEYKMDIISRLPERYKLADELINQAITEGNWTELGTFSDYKNAAVYKSASFERELFGEKYRCVVVHSSSLDKRKLKALDSRIEKEKRELDKITEEIGKREFFCEKDAQIELEKFYRENKPELHNVASEIIEVEKDVKREKPGRPKKGEVPLKEKKYIVKLESTKDEIAYKSAKEKCGIFVLITTLLNMLTYTDREILYQYKGQQSAENIFKFLKDPTFVGAYCLKNPERIVAFGYVLLMAAQVYTILEREVKKNLEDTNEEPVEGLNHNKTKKPTGYVIKYILSPILLIRKQNKKSEIWEPSKELSKNQKRILKLAGFDERIYYKSVKIGNYL